MNIWLGEGSSRVRVSREVKGLMEATVEVGKMYLINSTLTVFNTKFVK